MIYDFIVNDESTLIVDNRIMPGVIESVLFNKKLSEDLFFNLDPPAPSREATINLRIFDSNTKDKYAYLNDWTRKLDSNFRRTLEVSLLRNKLLSTLGLEFVFWNGLEVIKEKSNFIELELNCIEVNMGRIPNSKKEEVNSRIQALKLEEASGMLTYY